jgi:hypothetical protein
MSGPVFMFIGPVTYFIHYYINIPHDYFFEVLNDTMYLIERNHDLNLTA